MQHTGAGAMDGCRSTAAAGLPPGAPRAAAASERELVGGDRRQLRRRGADAAKRPDRRHAHGKSVRLRTASPGVNACRGNTLQQK